MRVLRLDSCVIVLIPGGKYTGVCAGPSVQRPYELMGLFIVAVHAGYMVMFSAAGCMNRACVAYSRQL